MSDQLTDEVREAMEKIQKLLNLAAKNSNEHEASAAMAKAQELLARYNLDAATVERESGVDGKREESLVDGGFYTFQRELWKAVAELNFCFYWTQKYWQPVDVAYRRNYDKDSDRYGKMDRFENVKKLKKRHRLIGRVVNTRTSIAMAQYLENVIERLLRERTKDVQSNWAMSFRQGVAHRMVEKVQDRRRGLLKAEADKQRAAERASERSGVSTSTALTLSDYVKSEHDANIDFVYGEGTSASWAADRAADAERRRIEREAHIQWAKDNPEEARKQAEERQKEIERENKNASRRKGRSYVDQRFKNTDMGAYYTGYDHAKDVSIDQQVDGSAKTRQIAKGK